MIDPLGSAALELARSGWEVFPLKGKAPFGGCARCVAYLPDGRRMALHPTGKCPHDVEIACHGVLDATSDPAIVEHWWGTHYRGANIGLRIPEHMFVLDIDPRNGADSTALIAEHGSLPDTLRSWSGRNDGGHHHFFTHPGGRLSGKGLPPGFDVKLRGGYVVAPPSVHPATGQPYRWEPHPVADPPSWLVELLRQPEPTSPSSARPSQSAMFSDPSTTADIYTNSTTWREVLEPHGWQIVGGDGDSDGSTWRHPAATAASSATIRHDLLFVYSTNTPFEPTEGGSPVGYTRFRAYAVLNHGGDLSAAAKTLWDARRQPASNPESLQPTRRPVVADSSELYLSVADLASLPIATPVITDVLDGNALFAITGRDGTYKSFLAFDWLACLATGTSWLGRFTTTPRRVLYVVGEGVYGLHVRSLAWQHAQNVGLTNGHLTIRRLPVNLFRGGQVFEELMIRIAEEQYGVVIFDTLQRMSSGADLNQSRDASMVIERLDALRRLIPGGSVGFVAHTGKSDIDIRGSSVLEDDVDIVWRLRRPEDAGGVIAKMHKRKDGPDGEELALVPHVVTGTGSLVLRESTRRELAQGDRQPKHALEILEYLALSVAADGVSSSGLAEAIGVRGGGSIGRALAWLHGKGLVSSIKKSSLVRWRITQLGQDRLNPGTK